MPKEGAQGSSCEPLSLSHTHTLSRSYCRISNTAHALLNHGKTSTQIYLGKSTRQASLKHYTLPFSLMGTLARSTLNSSNPKNITFSATNALSLTSVAILRNFDPSKEPRFLTKNSPRIWNQITLITSYAPKMNTSSSALPRIASESSVLQPKL